ncbi:MAG TPA: hypothetical protein VGD45_20585 [Steroidobacter sp.]|uniref:hypothetical protein n=1 Tax=Steroidobacter sp. TaxID=1978227 RepID=UPI002EDAC0ED
MFRSVAATLAIALLCAPVVHGAVETRTHTTYQVRRGKVNLPPAPTSKQECIDRADAAAEEEGKTRESGANDFQCHDVLHVLATFKPNPTCPALPPPEGRVVQCPSGTTGAYTQTKSWTAAPYPACAVEGEWVPTTPPASCVPVDTDSDGVPDSMDQCPTVPSTEPDGCPATPPTCNSAPADRVHQCPSGYSGTWTQRATVSPYPGCEITWSPVAWPPEACTPTSGPEPLFRDNFEYEVGRNITNADSLFGQRGWNGVKANNASAARGGGWVYTQNNSAKGSRVLVLESVPGPTPMQGIPYSQTDYYLQLGREGSTAQVLPANVWIQFWTYATPESRFSTRDKTIYPCSGHYACSWGPDLGWLFMWGSGGFNTSGDGSSRRFLAVEAQNADNRGDSEYPTNKAKLKQNLVSTPLAGGRWYQVRLHFDTSGAQGTYEAWVRELGQSAWTKVSDWRGGQTANFFWPIPENQRRGHTMFRLPTTVNGPGSSTVYIDDFVIGRSLAELPAN